MTGIRHRFLMAMGLASALALGGCAYDDGYGYGGVSVGSGYYGGGGYYDPYYGPGYYQPGLYSGWYDGFYYPGNGYYVYDRGGRRSRWNDGQRRYWEARRAEHRGDRGRGPDRWQGRPGGNDGRGDGRGNNWNRPRPPQGTPGTTPGGDPGRGGWRGNDGNRPPQASQPRPQGEWRDRSTPSFRTPQATQPRPQRQWNNGPTPSFRAPRQSGGGGRGPAPRVRPN